MVREVMANAAEPALKLDVPLDVEVGWGRTAPRIERSGKQGRRRPTLPRWRGGRINFFGFVLRLMARLPFLFIAGRMYGASSSAASPMRC